MTEKADMTVKSYSGGMKRRLEIARGLMHKPKVLFLDEPTVGLDPQTRRSIWDYIKELIKDDGMTIILTTHYMDEADYLCDRIAIVDRGKIVALDTPENLKNVMGGDVIMLETQEAEKLKGLLNGDWLKESKASEGRLMVTAASGEKHVPKIMDTARDNGIAISSVSVKKPTLEDVFIFYTGRGIRDEEASGMDAMKMHYRMGGFRR